MFNELTTVELNGVINYTAEEAEHVQELARAARADATRRVYRIQFNRFADFCNARGADYLPAKPEVVALYVSKLEEAGLSVSTLMQVVAAIRDEHLANGFMPSPTDDPRVKRVVSGARRRLGLAAKNKKAAATPDTLRALVETLDLTTLKGLRDRAIILLGFAGAFRRSELVALNVEDFEASTDEAGRKAYVITVRRSKTDQEGLGMLKAVFTTKDRELDPVKALDAYMTAAGITTGAIFRRLSKSGKLLKRLTGEAVAEVVKASAARAGIVSNLGGHSLRAGFVTTAMEHGASERSIMNQTGHKSVIVMRGYQRRVDAKRDNAAFGLL